MSEYIIEAEEGCFGTGTLVGELVRCKDCLYFLGKKGCGHIDGMATAEEDGFCSWAVRKGEQP